MTWRALGFSAAAHVFFYVIMMFWSTRHPPLNVPLQPIFQHVDVELAPPLAKPQQAPLPKTAAPQNTQTQSASTRKQAATKALPGKKEKPVKTQQDNAEKKRLARIKKEKQRQEKLRAEKNRKIRAAAEAKRLAALKAAELEQQQQIVAMIQQQVMDCWNITTEKVRNAFDVVVVVKLTLDKDGTITSMQVLHHKSTIHHPCFKAVENSVRNAFQRPSCKKLTLPAELYTMWKETSVRFSPQNAY